MLKEKVKWTRGEIKCEGEKRKDYEGRNKKAHLLRRRTKKVKGEK